MNKAQLYAEANGSQKCDAFFALKNYFHHIKWRDEGGDCVLDIGCGSGELSAYLINKIIPLSASRLLGIDMSDNMVQFARKNHIHPKLSFQLLNIVDTLCNDMIEQFDHILSFYCMHWIQNQKLAFQNVYNLLRPKGDMFMIFLAKNPVYEIYKNIAKIPKWKPYMQDINVYISPYHHSENPATELRHLLEDIHFLDIICKVIPRSYCYDDITSWRNFIISINPFLDRIPDALKEEYIDKYSNQMEKLNLVKETKSGKKYFLEYDLFVVYARKK